MIRAERLFVFKNVLKCKIQSKTYRQLNICSFAFRCVDMLRRTLMRKVWRAAQKIFTWISSAQRCFSTKFVEFCVWIVLQRVGYNFSGILGFQITSLLLLISEYFRCIFGKISPGDLSRFHILLTP